MTEVITLRPIGQEDEKFLCEVYASTRVTELARVPWSDEQKAAFLYMQFTAQHQYYQEHYPRAAFDVILVAGEPAGRLYVHRGADELRIVEIAILPAWRNKRVGTHLLGALQAEAALARKPLRIHVERLNPALSLYERLGFKMIEDRGVYLFLEWRTTE
jgi:ribosomal protein S18 acetylase RimI-like enzyme